MQEILLYCHAFSNLSYPSASQANRTSTGHHRIIDVILWFGRTFKDKFVPTLLLWTRTPITRPDAQSCIWPGLEHFQAWSTHGRLLWLLGMPHNILSLKSNFFWKLWISTLNHYDRWTDVECHHHLEIVRAIIQFNSVSNCLINLCGYFLDWHWDFILKIRLPLPLFS